MQHVLTLLLGLSLLASACNPQFSKAKPIECKDCNQFIGICSNTEYEEIDLAIIKPTVSSQEIGGRTEHSFTATIARGPNSDDDAHGFEGTVLLGNHSCVKSIEIQEETASGQTSNMAYQISRGIIRFTKSHFPIAGGAKIHVKITFFATSEQYPPAVALSAIAQFPADRNHTNNYFSWQYAR